MSTELQIHKATLRDKAQLLHLLQAARRSFVAFGAEDLPHLLASGDCLVAVARDQVRAVLCATVGRPPWAFLRGAAIADGWRADEALTVLLEPLAQQLSQRGVAQLAVYGTALWLPPLLLRVQFQRIDWIVTLERHPRPLPAARVAAAAIRHVTAADLPALAALDEAVFDPPYQLASGELIEYMVTSGYFVVAEEDGHLAGYACADVIGEEGQIIRVAVHPAARRRGIGGALLNAALTYCRDQQARLVMVNTQDSNQVALQLYASVGFRRVGRRVPVLVRALN